MQPDNNQTPDTAEESLTERALETPITGIEFGTVGLRRKLVKAGIKTVADLLAMSSHDIDRNFSYNEAGLLSNLIDKFQKSPDSTAKQLLDMKRDVSHSDSHPFFKDESFASPQAIHADWKRNDESQLPSWCKPLESINHDAEEVFTELQVQDGQMLAYLAFPALEEHLDVLSDVFFQFFKRCSSNAFPVVEIIERWFPDAFVIFIAYRASQDFDGENLWGNLFEKAGIRDGNLQTSLKKLFVSLLERRRMPVFAKGEETFCYFYTALLHGGLSKNLWKSLWRKSLLPLAKKKLKTYRGALNPIEGTTILNNIKTADASHAPGHAIKNLMNHIPEATLSPLMESAFQVALDVQQSMLVGSQCQLVSNDALSKVSLEALSEVIKELGSASEAANGSIPDTHPSSMRIARLPLAQMVLSPSAGTVRFVWMPCHLDESFSGDSITFSINGERKGAVQIEPRAGSSFFKGTKIDVGPETHYDVLIQLESASDASATQALTCRSIQHFTRQQKGYFEFFEGPNGTYRLRKPKERITKKRKVAYLVDSGLKLIPEFGMVSRAKLEMPDSWAGTHVYIFDAEPGSSGSIVDSATGKTISAWHESYRVSISKDFIIGKTIEGLDVYGYMPSPNSYNTSLPRITIETLDGYSAASNIMFICNVDGIEFPLDKRIIKQEDSRTATVVLDLQYESHIGLYVHRCAIDAFTGSERQNAILHYAFSVIPIQDFHPELKEFKLGSPVMAKYVFTAAIPLRIAGTGLDKSLPKGAKAGIVIPLSEESLELSFATETFPTLGRPRNLETTVDLALAGVEIELPRLLQDAASSGDVTIANLIGSTPSERAITITCHGHRNFRGMYASLGLAPLFYGDLGTPGTYRLDLYSQPTLFADDGEGEEKRMELQVVLYYGDDSHSRTTFSATSNMTILHCLKGLGFSSWKLCRSETDEEMLKLDAPIICDSKASFYHRGYLRDSLLGSFEIQKGDDNILLSKEITRALDTGKSLAMEISPVTLFGDAIPELSSTYSIEREQHDLQR